MSRYGQRSLLKPPTTTNSRGKLSLQALNERTESPLFQRRMLHRQQEELKLLDDHVLSDIR